MANGEKIYLQIYEFVEEADSSWTQLLSPSVDNSGQNSPDPAVKPSATM